MSSGWENFTLEMMCSESYSIYQRICGEHSRPEDVWFELEGEDTRADIEANGHDPDSFWGDFAGEDEE